MRDCGGTAFAAEDVLFGYQPFKLLALEQNSRLEVRPES